MTSIGPVSSGGASVPARKEEGITHLAEVVVLEALSFLDEESLKSATLVSREFRKAAIDSSKQDQAKIVRASIDFLLKQKVVEKHPDIVKALSDLAKNNPVLGSVNLMQIKKNQAAAIGLLCAQVAKLDEKELASLEEAYSKGAYPKPLGTLLALAPLYKEVERLRALPDGDAKDIALSDVAKKLVALGDVEKAFEAATLIRPDSRLHPMAIWRPLVKTLLEKNLIDTLLKLAKSSPNPSRLLVTIAHALAVNGAIDRALEVSDMPVLKSNHREDAVYLIAESLIGDPNTRKRALEVARTMHEIYWIQNIYGRVASAYKEEGNIKKAQQVRNRIKDL